MVKKNLGEKKGGSQYLVIFWRFLDLENFYKCLTFQGGKKLLLQGMLPGDGGVQHCSSADERLVGSDLCFAQDHDSFQELGLEFISWILILLLLDGSR